MTVARLNWACGPVLPEDWTNSDESEYAQAPPGRYPEHLGAIQDGLPWVDGHFAYVVAHHALCMLSEHDLIPALAELRRVTKPGGWLRVSVPDIGDAVIAWRGGDSGWFPLVAEDVDEAFCLYVTQGGATRSIFTEYRLARLLAKAGWVGIRECSPYQSDGPEGITELDSRPGESIYMEARHGAAVSPAG